MKAVAEVLRDLSGKIERCWVLTLAAEAGHTPAIEFESTAGTSGSLATPSPTASAWPLRLPIGRPSKAVLRNDWPTVAKQVMVWRQFEADHQHITGLEIRWDTRLTDGIRETLPTHLTVPSIDIAAQLVGQGWSTRLASARTRVADLTARFPHAVNPATITQVVRLDDVDYALLCTAAEWFARNDASGLTPRQVPIEGLHGKWLNGHHKLVQTLAGKESLGLTARPTRVHYTYLDPEHRSAGRRHHDSHTLSDNAQPLYLPDIIIIAENKDTAVYFPPTPGAVIFEGNGNAGPTLIPQIPWVHAARQIIYWGDIDATGYVLLHRYRSNGLPVTSMLMDHGTYDTYERYGAWTDEKKAPVPCRPRESLTLLTVAEQEVYQHLTDPDWGRVRRIEQERIPLPAANAALREVLATAGADVRSS